MNVQPFNGIQAATVNIDVGASTARVALGTTGNGYRQVRVYNDGTATAWIAFGDVTITAALASGIPLAAGACEVHTIPNGVTYVAAIAAAGTGKIYFTPGSGI